MVGGDQRTAAELAVEGRGPLLHEGDEELVLLGRADLVAADYVGEDIVDLIWRAHAFTEYMDTSAVACKVFCGGM